MKSYTIRNARAELADVIGAAQYGGETVEITKHGKPVARVVPADAATSEAPALDPDLAAAVEDYAGSHGLDRDAAIAALLRAGLAANTKQTGIEALFPEAAELDGAALHELVLEDQTELGESVEYDYDGVEAQYEYAKARGRWLYTVSRPTGVTNARGCRVWEHEYTVCDNKREAKKLYREAIIAASKHWREGTDSMWCDADGPVFLEGFSKDRAIPLGAWGADGYYDDE